MAVDTAQHAQTHTHTSNRDVIGVHVYSNYPMYGQLRVGQHHIDAHAGPGGGVAETEGGHDLSPVQAEPHRGHLLSLRTHRLLLPVRTEDELLLGVRRDSHLSAEDAPDQMRPACWRPLSLFFLTVLSTHHHPPPPPMTSPVCSHSVSLFSVLVRRDP